MLAILSLGLLSLGLGLLLGYAADKFALEGDPVADQINDLLPQTQCGQCGYSGCRPYAKAIASGDADINQCPPGGDATIRALADLLGREAKPLNLDNGVHQPASVAVIDESLCIGCTICIEACPVDAILGAGKQMHTVIESECTGCKLCLDPCPVDCISMKEPTGESRWRAPSPDALLLQKAG